MRLLVTGGAGFIGSNFVRRTLSQREDVSQLIVLDALTYAGTLTNLSSVMEDRRFTFIQGDVRDAVLVEDLFAQSDAVVHFAAESHVDRSISGSKPFSETNVLGTHTLLEAARHTELATFVMVSTDEVYGSIESGSWDENEPLLPNSPYSASKAGADLLCRAFYKTYGMDIRITRCSNNYGPHQFPEKVIPLFVTNLIDDLPVPLYGTGRQCRDWLHVNDHCDGISLVLEKGTAGETYNIGGGHELTNLELTKLILNLMEKDDSYIHPVADRLGHDLRYSVDITKISSALGYAPKVQFDEGLASTVEWYRRNEAWWRPLKARS